MDDEDRIRQVVEELIRSNRWADSDVQRALLEVARQHIWKQGLWARMKFIVNIAGFIGVVGSVVMTAFAIFGFDVVRK